MSYTTVKVHCVSPPSLGGRSSGWKGEAGWEACIAAPGLSSSVWRTSSRAKFPRTPRRRAQYVYAVGRSSIGKFEGHAAKSKKKGGRKGRGLEKLWWSSVRVSQCSLVLLFDMEPCRRGCWLGFTQPMKRCRTYRTRIPRGGGSQERRRIKNLGARERVFTPKAGFPRASTGRGGSGDRSCASSSSRLRWAARS